MTTIPDSLKATLDAGWTAAGGAEPTYYVKEDYNTYNMPPAGKDYIWIDTTSHKKTPRPVNDTYANITNTIDIYVNTLTSADRRKEIADEVARILNSTAITGVNLQWVSDRIPVRPDKIRGQHMEKIQVTMLELMNASASAYGAGTTGDFAVVGELTVSTYNILDALMLGSANAAWVPCVFIGTSQAGKMITSYHFLTNVDDTDQILTFELLLPRAKGSLKLYIGDVRIGLKDADAGDYITAVYVYGYTDHASSSTITSDATDKTTPAIVTYTIAATDASSYYSVKIALSLVCTNAADIDISFVHMLCYYDT